MFQKASAWETQPRQHELQLAQADTYPLGFFFCHAQAADAAF